MSVAFDTLRAARRLRDEGGFDEKQAGILVATFAEGMSEGLASKADLEKTESVLRSEIGELRSDLEKTESALRSDLEKTESALRSDLEKTESALRSDLEKTESALRSEIGGLRSDMEKLEQRMTIRLGGMLAVGLGIVVALLKLL